jgi:hypothetical protein
MLTTTIIITKTPQLPMRMKKIIGGIPKINSSFVVVLIVVVTGSVLTAAIDGLVRDYLFESYLIRKSLFLSSLIKFLNLSILP